MIHLPWLNKVWNTVHILGATLILFGLSIDILTAFSLPDWAWAISNVIVRFFAVYLCIRTFGTWISYRMSPRTYSGISPLSTCGVCLLAGSLAIIAFVCSFTHLTFFSIMSFICTCISFFIFLCTETTLSRYATKWRQQLSPSHQDTNTEQTVVNKNSHLTPSTATNETESPIAYASSAQKVFICNDIEDATWTRQMRGHLHLLDRLGLIDLWDQTKIPPGAIRRDEIDYAIESAGVAIILISANLLSSDYIMEYQLPTLLKYAESRGTWVIPIEARDCCYRGTGLEHFQSVVVPGKRPKALEAMSVADRNELFSHLAELILLRLGIEPETSQMIQPFQF